MKSEPRWWRSAWVKSLVLAVIVLGGFYAHQNLLGAMAWKKVQREIAAAGESLDPATMEIPSVPEEQNLGALPIFRVEVDAEGKYWPQALSKAVSSKKIGLEAYKNKPAKPDELPYIGSPRKGERTDPAAVHAQLAQLCHLPATTSLTSLELFTQICPLLAELRTAGKTHPECLFFPGAPLPVRRTATNILVNLNRPLDYERRLALLEKQPAVAYKDLELGWKMTSGMRSIPGVIAAVITQASLAVDLGPVKDGLVEHAWNDSQLAGIDGHLGEFDCLKIYQRGFRTDIAFYQIPNLDEINQDRRALAKSWFFPAGDFWKKVAPSDWVETLDRTFTPILAYLTPSGWVTQFKAESVRFNLLHLVPLVDPRAHRVYPDKCRQAQIYFENLPGSIYWRTSVGMAAYSFESTLTQAAAFQVAIDQARLACRLERSRLAHGVYPATLAELESTYGPNPTDPLSGEAYRYQLKTDGSYLLYSVGWNQKDDGGETAKGKSYREMPDWVWFTGPPVAGTK